MANIELSDILRAIEYFDIRTGRVVTIEGQKGDDVWLRFEGERSRVPVSSREELDKVMEERWMLGLTLRGALDIIEKFEDQGGAITTIEGLSEGKHIVRLEGGRGLVRVRDDRSLRYLLTDQFLPRT